MLTKFRETAIRFNSYPHPGEIIPPKVVFRKNSVFLFELRSIGPPSPGLIFYGGFDTISILFLLPLEVLQNEPPKLVFPPKIRKATNKIISAANSANDRNKN